MKVYKFRSMEQLSFTFDILFNRRLFCSEWEALNDPMEAHWIYSYSSESNDDFEDRIESISREIRSRKVCSLSKSMDNHLLWSHYASGARGLALEVELPENDPCVESITYCQEWNHVDIEADTAPEEIAKRICLSKLHDWAYENEVRILTDSRHYALTTGISKIVCGARMDPAAVMAFLALGNNLGIPVSQIIITDDGLMDFPPRLPSINSTSTSQ